MVIEPGKPSYNRGTSNTVQGGSRSAPAPTSAAPAHSGQSSTADVVHLSSQAQELGRLEQLARNAADVDMAKVEALKQAIAEGQYQIDSGALADKILASDSDF